MLDLIADIRRDYMLKTLTESDVHTDAIAQFEIWWKEAIDSKIDEVNAMTLATASSDGVPAARIVLMKGFSRDGFIFYTNYDSFKGRQLSENPRACLVFFWKELERQVRITGLVSRTNAVESDDYFNSRPVGSRLSAIVSPQSRVISGRDWLEAQAQKIAALNEGKPLQRPAHWGGFLVNPVTIEFWQGRSNRLHDRLQYSLNEDGTWTIERLAP